MPFKNPHPLYSVWRSMISRCEQPRARQFADYGGRGISVCPRWRRSFAAFLDDMGPRPIGYCIDRINNDGNYEPTNCRWVTRRESQSNRRVTKRVTIEGTVYVLSDLARRSGLKPDTIWERAKHPLSLDQLLAPERRVYAAGLALGGAANGRRQRAKTHCPHGHAYTSDNTSLTPDGARVCKACRREKARREHLGKK